jgi:tRNA modification GTPase
VVAIGPPNIGKSSLLNALAGRPVAVVADEPGTTRDHVGVMIDLAGLVVRYIDAPGIGTGAGWSDAERRIQDEAQVIALKLARSADLVVLCADGGSDFLAPPPGVRAHVSELRIGLRSDLGRPRAAHDLAVSVRAGGGLADLVRLMRDRLVPPALLADQRAWAFWP